MRFVDLIRPKDIFLDLEATTKSEAIESVCTLIKSNHIELQKSDVCFTLLERERLGSTGIGDEVAIPHGKIDGINHLIAGLARSSSGIPFDAIDGQPVKIMIVLLAPGGSAGAHLKALAKVSKLLRNTKFKTSLMEAATPEEIYELFEAYES